MVEFIQIAAPAAVIVVGIVLMVSIMLTIEQLRDVDLALIGLIFLTGIVVGVMCSIPMCIILTLLRQNLTIQ